MWMRFFPLNLFRFEPKKAKRCSLRFTSFFLKRVFYFIYLFFCSGHDRALEELSSIWEQDGEIGDDFDFDGIGDDFHISQGQ